MMIPRLYTGRDGESHFAEIDVPVGRLQRTTGLFIRRYAVGEVQNWHPAPRRQFVVTLSGECEIVLGDGTRRRFRPGDIMLADDTTGRGHITRTLGNEPRICINIPLP